jgi:type I restriction enzyme M protein
LENREKIQLPGSGVDNDKQMVQLAQLNMLLNGDGRSILKFQSGMGSISHKFNTDNELIPLIPEMHKNGNWDNNSNDYIRLKKFDIVLTNPPFGENRAFVPHNEAEKSLIECYETWNLYGGKEIDLGVVFLENAYRILKENGRIGIVLSNSIASIDTHKTVRKWLMDRMRIVAIFDLPANVFGETGVNVTIIVAYKPKDDNLERLKEQNYQIFSKDIQNIGYEVKTNQRVKLFSPIYKVNYETFEIEIDDNGRALLDEDFAETIANFKQWCIGQEKQLQNIFIKEK